MYHGQSKERIRKCILTMGLFVWIGLIGPELLLQQGMGCLDRKDGKEITNEDISLVLDTLLKREQLEDMPEIEYKSKILEWLKGDKK